MIWELLLEVTALDYEVVVAAVVGEALGMPAVLLSHNPVRSTYIRNKKIMSQRCI